MSTSIVKRYWDVTAACILRLLRFLIPHLACDIAVKRSCACRGQFHAVYMLANSADIDIADALDGMPLALVLGTVE